MVRGIDGPKMLACGRETLGLRKTIKSQQSFVENLASRPTVSSKHATQRRLTVANAAGGRQLSVVLLAYLGRLEGRVFGLVEVVE
jgi:hypothetical protein